MKSYVIVPLNITEYLGEILRQAKTEALGDSFRNAFRELWYAENELDAMTRQLVGNPESRKHFTIKTGEIVPEAGGLKVPFEFDTIRFVSDYEKVKYAQIRKEKEQEAAQLAALENQSVPVSVSLPVEQHRVPTNLDKIEELFDMGMGL